MILHIKNYYCKDTENELKSFHNKTDWAKFVRMQDSWLLLKSDSISWRKTLKNSHNTQIQWLVVSTPCQEKENSSEPKGWIRGNTKIGPVWEVTTCYLQGKYGVVIRIESVNKDHSHSWVRISHGLNKLVTDLIDKEYDDNEQETSEMQFEDCALKSNVLAFASRSKAKAKPQRRIFASPSTRTLPIGERKWTDIEPEDHSPVEYQVSEQLSGSEGTPKLGPWDFASSFTKNVPTGERSWTDIEPQDYSLIDYPVSNKLIHPLRHGNLPRDNDGAIEFWRIKDHLQNHFVHSRHWFWWKVEEHHGRRRRRKENISVLYWFFRRNSLPPSSSRSFRTQSCWSIITGQCLDSGRFFFKDIYHVGCAINLHSIINSGLIPGGPNLSKRQTVFFLPVNPMDKEHKDLETIDLEAPRLARYMHTAWKKHQNTVCWVDINLAQKKGLKFYQTRSNNIILHETLPAYCIPKVVRMGTGEIKNEKVYASPPPPKISLKHDWMKELGSEVARQPEGEIVRQAKGSQPTQPNPNPNHARTGDPLFALKEEHPVLRKSKHVLLVKKLQITIERWDPLFAHKMSAQG